MDRSAIAGRRLLNQRIAGAGYGRPADVVAWFGAMQAQEYEPAKWGIGLRMKEGALDTEVERAFERGQILRTHVMRPTWHFVTAADIRWLLDLTAPRMHQRLAPYDRHLELDAATMKSGTAVIERALRDGRYLTRAELAERLRDAGMPMKGQRLAHLVAYAEIEGVICSGPRRGKQFTYALLVDRAPAALRLDRDEALAELCRRYFRGHGPATIRDFVWWSGLTTADAKRGLEIIRAKSQEIEGRIYWSVDSARPRAKRASFVELLPIYDEYIVAYRDREAVPHPSGSQTAVIFQHALLVDGQVAGTWGVSRKSGALSSVAVYPLRPLKGRERRALDDAVDRFAHFRGVAVKLSVG